MKIKLNNQMVLSAINSLSDLMAEKLPSKISWNLNKNFRILSDHLKDYTECELTLIKRCAFKDSNGEVKFNEQQRFEIMPEYIDEYNKEMKDLLNCEDEIEIHVIKLSDLEKVDVSGKTLYNIEFMIDDKENT
ncbi:hypothetical protein [Anaerosporobacter sp.]